jgi:hypothetical protein
VFLSCDICNWDRCQATILQALRDNTLRSKDLLLVRLVARKSRQGSGANVQVARTCDKKIPDAQASGIYLSCFRYYLGNLVDDLDINDFAVDDRHLLVLAIIGRVVVDRGFIAVVVAVTGINGIRIIVIN